ncbi:unnamed protein product [Polarella glacialis]|uniref:Uncharacterized protein n=1 Tax=Polarella glacialis TaxID=89957 RepID=A0A813D817_POLGL|nr:unnamed protein product [Polarella glacialis]CAE8696421.1 unnamed protein product [Polarella glacialis]
MKKQLKLTESRNDRGYESKQQCNRRTKSGQTAINENNKQNKTTTTTATTTTATTKTQATTATTNTTNRQQQQQRQKSNENNNNNNKTEKRKQTKAETSPSILPSVKLYPPKTRAARLRSIGPRGPGPSHSLAPCETQTCALCDKKVAYSGFTAISRRILDFSKHLLVLQAETRLDKVAGAASAARAVTLSCSGTLVSATSVFKIAAKLVKCGGLMVTVPPLSLAVWLYSEPACLAALMQGLSLGNKKVRNAADLTSRSWLVLPKTSLVSSPKSLASTSPTVARDLFLVASAAAAAPLVSMMGRKVHVLH